MAELNDASEQAAIAEDEYYGSDAEDLSDADEVLDSDDDEAEENAFLPRRQSASRRPSNFLEFQQESLSRAQVLKRLVFCSLMLNATFVMWGALQVCRSIPFFLKR